MLNQSANYLLNSILAESNRWEWNLDRQLTLLGVSGGRDSIALLMAFVELKFPVVVCHVNYGLRGSDSDEDAHFVKAICAKNNVKCYILNVLELEDSKFEKQLGESTQIWARRVRYDFFQRIMEEEGAAHMAVAHHLQDHFEHLFIYLSRGQNHHAFSGMRIQNGKLIRPILKVKPSAIVQFLKERGAGWREDASNASLTYLRNRVRWGLVEPLIAEDEGILEAFLESSEGFQLEMNHKHELFEKKWPNSQLKNGWWFKLSDRWLFWGVMDDILRGLGFTGSDIEQFFSKPTKVGAYRESGQYVMCSERNNQVLIYEKLSLDERNDVWRINIPLKWRDKQLEIREWKQGDVICLISGNKLINKKISDVFVDLKWDRRKKHACRLLLVDGKIMAIEDAKKASELEMCHDELIEIVVHGKNIG